MRHGAGESLLRLDHYFLLVMEIVIRNPFKQYWTEGFSITDRTTMKSKYKYFNDQSKSQGSCSDLQQ